MSVDSAPTPRYARAVSARARVEFTSPERDRPNWFALTVTALIATGLGVGAASLWLSGPPAERTSPAAQSAVTDAPADAAPTEQDQDQEQEPSPETRPESARIAENLPQAIAQAADAGSHDSATATRRSPAAETTVMPVAPQQARATEPQVTRHVEMGVVAYVRCDGVPQRKGPFPCPRDRAFERSVWRALRGLESCKQAAADFGTGDVRIEFAMHGPPRVHVLPGVGDPLSPQIVTDCVGQALSATRTVLAPERMVVSFRFELR